MIFKLISVLTLTLVHSKKCDLECDAPYVLNQDDCACNAKLSVAPSACAAEFTANNTLCQCINSGNASENYSFEC